MEWGEGGWNYKGSGNTDFLDKFSGSKYYMGVIARGRYILEGKLFSRGRGDELSENKCPRRELFKRGIIRERIEFSEGKNARGKMS